MDSSNLKNNESKITMDLKNILLIGIVIFSMTFKYIA